MNTIIPSFFFKQFTIILYECIRKLKGQLCWPDIHHDDTRKKLVQGKFSDFLYQNTEINLLYKYYILI